MPTLYRDYRPEKFADILGQNHLKISLENEIATGRLGQAYLFCGPRAVGKTTMARVLAKAANCLNIQAGQSEPCGECQSCLDISSGRHLDVVEIDAASNTGVDNVRDNVIAFARLAPSKARYKVFIIDEVHMLSLSAFNALLKIIEEPPKQVLFILCTTEVHKVPGTIISRCQRFDFKRIVSSEIVKKLQYIIQQEKIQVDLEVLQAIARESGGHLRDAESLLGQILALGDKNISLDTAELVLPKSRTLEAVNFLEYLANQQAGEALALLNQLVEEGVNLKTFIEENITILRKLLLHLIQPGLAEKLGLDFGEEIEKRMLGLSQAMNSRQALLVLRHLLNALAEKNASFPQLPLEMAIVELSVGSAISNNQSLSSTKQNLPPSNPIPSSSKSTADNKSNQTNKAPADGLVLASDLSCQEVKDKWPEFLVKIKKYNHSLSFILQNCSPQDLKAGQLKLIFKYKFHRDRALDSGVKPLIEKTLTEVFGGKIRIQADLDENFEMPPINSSVDSPDNEKIVTEKPITNSPVNNLIKTFGGQIIS